MRTNASNVLKVLMLGAAILINGGVVLAANGTGGFNGHPTIVSCACIGGWGTSTIKTGSTNGVPTGYATGSLGNGVTSHTPVGPGNALGGAVTVNGGSSLGSTGQGGQVGNPDGGGTLTYQNG